MQVSETDMLRSHINFKFELVLFNIENNIDLLASKICPVLNFSHGSTTSSPVENIETDSTASERQRKQKGDYFDNYLDLKFDYDIRNQKFKTTDGFRSLYTIGLPIISENNTVKNYYNYKFI